MRAQLSGCLAFSFRSLCDSAGSLAGIFRDAAPFLNKRIDEP
jgi:hypothetical protein